MIEGIGKVYLGTKEIVKAYLGNKVVYNSAPALDPDAEAFLLAAGITDATITDAINNLVLSLKADSLWTKMKAIYPLVGGTASTHKFNLKNPVDSDAAFRLTFVGSPTHSANGLQGNGSSQYARTHLNNNQLSQNAAGLFLYSRTDLAADIIDMSGINTSFVGNELFIKVSSNVSGGRINSSSVINDFSQPSTGFYGAFRSSSANIKVVRESTIVDRSSTSSAPINVEIELMVRNVLGSRSLYSSRQYGFFGISDGITTNTEINNVNTSIQNFVTAINRNV
jgi:hypothetical protein